MSAHFAIPATTFVLKSIIEKRIKAAYGTLAAPLVSVEPPPRPAAPASGPGPTPPQAETPGLILFMHHVTANPAWRNMYDPHVSSVGARVSKAALVLDLHYMLGALGSDLEREALLGIGMSALHRNGIVPRPMIEQLMSAITVPPTPTRLMDSLTTESLHDPASQPESITISQQPLDLDAATKLWSAFQSPLRPAAYYLATTVFLDTDEMYPPAGLVDRVTIAGRPVVDPTRSGVDDDVIVTEAHTP